jgi:uncharacterized membrane protein YeaQ/YmgE (transglycosylase-associated protein family)
MLSNYCVGCIGSSTGMSLAQLWDVIIAAQVLIMVLGTLGAAAYFTFRK